MPNEKPLSVDPLRQYHRGLARWENEGGSAAPAETTRSEAQVLDQYPLWCEAVEANADSPESACNI
jgi:hypothetical protein